MRRPRANSVSHHVTVSPGGSGAGAAAARLRCVRSCQSTLVLVTGLLPAGGPGPESLTNAGSATALSNHQGAFSTAVALDCHVCTQGCLRRKHPRERIMREEPRYGDGAATPMSFSIPLCRPMGRRISSGSAQRPCRHGKLGLFAALWLSNTEGYTEAAVCTVAADGTIDAVGKARGRHSGHTRAQQSSVGYAGGGAALRGRGSVTVSKEPYQQTASHSCRTAQEVLEAEAAVRAMPSAALPWCVIHHCRRRMQCYSDRTL
jgi:hypothetical protein